VSAPITGRGSSAAPAAFAVVIPARDEEALVGRCLQAVRRALATSSVPSSIVLVAHRCTDRTAEVARELLTGPGEVVIENESPSVATARAAGAALAVSALRTLQPPASPAARCWLLSTDADSEVPLTWLSDLRRHIDNGAAAVAGLVQVQGWEGSSAVARQAYRAILAAGMKVTHHEHVYAANLAVRLDAYLDVGGWPDETPGEDAALLAALRDRGWPVVSPTDVWVRTSGRRVARADGGLGALLNRLTIDATDVTSGTR
jgi:glycosyltransferase involved in cell wall biosynthesis